jgi:alkyl sulfatase BDS1-like metallo-beta-lactamase superfamily hydrolase
MVSGVVVTVTAWPGTPPRGQDKEIVTGETREYARMPADFADRTDFENATRGLVARLEPGVIKAADGRVVYDADAFTRTIAGDCPDTVHPSLWRQSQLTAIQGLFEVTAGIYQLRGIELSNMTVVEGQAGVIVIDPAVSAEVSAAGLALYRAHRSDRPVTAVIYTHSHIDHFGGVLGVVDAGTDVPIVAPEHFLEHAVSENVYAGVAMLRRGIYHTGATLPVSATGQVGVGLGSGTSTGTVGLLAPTLDITHTGQEETLDGVRIVFQMTPGTEAPAEMNFLFPDKRALCMAENVTHNLHNLLTLRGAQVRDARIWSRYIAEAIELFADGTDVAFASHHWPTWGTGNVVKLMTGQRDLYAYLHDQTLRLLNQGYVGSEVAELIEVPPALDAAWHTHGYYGSVSHNVKAIYQRYLGWYDGNPAHLWQHPPEAAATRYVQALGGPDATVAKAREFADAGDLRFAAELASHAVFADPSSEPAKTLLADVLTRLGYGSECATWRNNYLTGARELGGTIAATEVSAAGMAPALTTTQLFDSLAIRIDGKRAWDTNVSIRWHFTDSGETFRMELSNGALIHHPTSRTEPADLVVTLTRPQLLAMLGGAGTDSVQFDGNPKIFTAIAGLTDQPDPNFAIVTP